MSRRVRLTDAAVARLQPAAAEYTVRDTRTAGLGVRVRPAGGKSYVFHGRAASEPTARKHTLGPVAAWSVADARRACADLEAGARSPAPGRTRSGPAGMRFRDFVETEWKPAFCDGYKRSTRKRVNALLRRRLLPAFGSSPLERVTPMAVHAWFDRYSGAAPGGANRALCTLKTILRYAVARGLLQRDPTRGVRPNRRARRTRFLSKEELGRLHRELDACVRERRSRLPQADIIRLLLLTGCRLGEILHLRRDEVDGDTLRLRDSKTGPKAVYLSADAQRILARQPHAASPYVFPSPRDDARPRCADLSLWKLARRRAGLDDVRLHDCRHTFASQAVLQGIPIPVVARLLGHRKVSMTFRYAHVRDPEVEAAAERIGAAIKAHLDAGRPTTDRPTS